MKIIIMEPDRDKPEKVIKTKDSQRVFLLIGSVVYLAEPGQSRLWMYGSKKERKRLLCKAHYDIIENHLK